MITRYLPKNLITCYLGAEITGALLASIFVKYAIGTNANLGANVPNYNFPLPIIFGIEVLASSLLKIVILLVIYTKGLKGFSGIVIGGIIGLDIFFFGFISGGIDESREAPSACIAFRIGRRFMVILDYSIYWSFYRRNLLKTQI
ncbi:MAG: hypothetical protein QOK62_09130 [Nitrososphaeraceae archaeon]|nr:hypothetical protein [Nitrososphaeraceae archaeon]